MNLTIIVTTHDKYFHKLSKCLESIKNISQKLQLIVANDTKNKISKKLIKKIIKEKNFKNFYIYEHYKKGISVLRNASLNYVKNDWVSFIDGDDCVSGKFKNINNFLKIKTDLLIFDNEIKDKFKIKPCEFYGFTGLIERLEIKNMVQKYLKNPRANSIITHVWSKIYNINFIKKNKFKFKNNLSVNEDLLFNSQYIYKCNKIYLNKKKFISYTPSKKIKLKKRHNFNDKSYIQPIKNLSNMFLLPKRKNLQKIAYLYWEKKISIINENKY